MRGLLRQLEWAYVKYQFRSQPSRSLLTCDASNETSCSCACGAETKHRLKGRNTAWSIDDYQRLLVPSRLPNSRGVLIFRLLVDGEGDRSHKGYACHGSQSTYSTRIVLAACSAGSQRLRRRRRLQQCGDSFSFAIFMVFLLSTSRSLIQVLKEH